jgi:hypothetical protein
MGPGRRTREAAGEFTWVKGAGHEIESSRPGVVLATVDVVFEKAIKL